MRSRLTKLVIASSLMVAMFIMLNPASAASAYHMNGQGTITIGGAGLPACAGSTPNCSSPDNSFSWGELTVQGAGVLNNNAVAGTYTCRSEGTIGGTPFESRIYGNTANFALTFNFQCTRDAGSVGPAFINGWFSNVTTEALGGAYRSVSSHPHPTPVKGGAPFFKGYFIASNTHPNSISSANGEAMTCGGGFAPNGYNFGTNTIPTAAFIGACTAGDS